MSAWADSHGLTEIENAVAANQWNGVPLPPEIAAWLNTQAGGATPQDQWNNFVRTAQDRESGDEWYQSPAVAFAALTGGLGGMTGANLATGGDVRQGVVTDLAALGAGAGLAAALPATGLSTVAGASGAAGEAGAGGTLLADAGGMTDVPIAWDAATGAAAAPAPSAMAGGAYDLGGGLYVDETGAVTGGLFQGGAGTAGAADFAASAPWYAPATALASKIPLSRLTDGITLKYLLDKASKGAPAAIGAYGASEQAQAYRDMAQKYLDIGAPSRSRFEASFAPGFSMANEPGYADALALTTKETLHQLSPNTGNPSMSPNAWEQTLKDVNAKFAFPALDNYRRLNAGAGGLAALNSSAPGADANAIKAQGGVYDALGAGVADVFNPPKSLADILREMKQAGY